VGIPIDVPAGPPLRRLEWRLSDGLAGAGLALRFVATTRPGRLVAATVALCAVVSYLDFGVTYEAKAFVGAALAVGASVLSEVAFGAFIRVGATRRAHWWRAGMRGLGGVGGALFASGGLDALRLSATAHTVMLVAIVWIAVAPVLADVIGAYRSAGDRRALEGAVSLRALLGAAAAGGLVLYGIGRLLPPMWWLAALPLVLAGVAGCASLLAHAGRATGDELPGESAALV
jgi:hypothetical protein